MELEKEEIKYHKEALAIIEQFKKPKSGRFISKNQIFNAKAVKFKLNKKGFTVNFGYQPLPKKGKDNVFGKYHKGVQIKFGKTIYKLESVFIGQQTFLSSTGINAVGSVDRIHTIGYSEKIKYYYQLIIPLEKELHFHYSIEETPFSTDLGYKTISGVTAFINGIMIKAYCIHDNKKKYFLAIDCDIKQSFKEFDDKSFTLKIAIGYLTGYYAGDQGYYFAYTKKDKKEPKLFRVLSLRDSIRSGYKPIYSNAYGYLHNNRSLAEKYYHLLRPVSINEFSVLCEKIYNSSEFASVLMLIIESSVASLLFMPGGYAIALETISDLIIGKKKLKLAPIKDKNISREIRKELSEILDFYKATIDPCDLEILKIRVDQINQTTNKARLKAPFDLLGITLLGEDLKILETRNDFLHGRVPDLTNVGKMRSTERLDKDLFYCSMRFYTLLNMIILKWVGYDNRVVNYPKIQERATQISLNEEPFRQV